VKLQLAQVEDLNHRQAGNEHAFALGFAAPRSASPLATRVPTILHHPALGRFRLLLVPGAPSGTPVGYWAVINRLRA
jgi:hypothetical protein